MMRSWSLSRHGSPRSILGLPPSDEKKKGCITACKARRHCFHVHGSSQGGTNRGTLELPQGPVLLKPFQGRRRLVSVPHRGLSPPSSTYQKGLSPIADKPDKPESSTETEGGKEGRRGGGVTCPDPAPEEKNFGGRSPMGLGRGPSTGRHPSEEKKKKVVDWEASSERHIKLCGRSSRFFPPSLPF